VDNESEPIVIEERPHPGDVTAAEKRTVQRRLLLGLLIGVSLNIAFLSGGAAIANYLTKIFYPFFFHDKIVYVEIVAPPSPSPSATATQPSPAPR